jgi:hypothetical protein
LLKLSKRHKKKPKELPRKLMREDLPRRRRPLFNNKRKSKKLRKLPLPLPLLLPMLLSNKPKKKPPPLLLKLSKHLQPDKKLKLKLRPDLPNKRD